MDERIRRRRSPWVAAVLSLVCTGLGHVYCGRVHAGLRLFLLFVAIAPLLAILLALPVSPAVPYLLVTVAPLSLVLVVYAVIGSVWIALCRSTEYRPTRWNRWGVYLLLGLAGQLLPLGGAYFIRDRVAHPLKVPTASMAPTIAPGDRVLVSRLAYGRRDPGRLEVAVFRCPEDREVFHVKRIVGVPGDRVRVEGGRLWVNGEEVLLPGVVERGSRRAEVDLGEGRYFVLGDNRGRSRDSRHYGPVPRGDFLGPVVYRYWPLDARFGVID